jgi:FkbM family methyltransferase
VVERVDGSAALVSLDPVASGALMAAGVPDWRTVKKGARTALRRTGFDVRRIRPETPPEPDPNAFYDVSPTCQVVGLDFLYQLFLGRRRDGVFVEVGAFDGYTCSNTSCLATAGWAGHYLEPVPSAAARCRERHADHPRVRVHEVAVGAEAGELTMHVGGIYSTADEATLAEYHDTSWATDSFAEDQTVRVPLVTLDQFLDDAHVDPGFDVLIVDVEGGEPAVFAGFDLPRHRPTIMIVELADAHPDLVASRPAHAQVLLDIVDAGYVIAYKDAINTMFVTRERYLESVGLA